MQKILSIIIPTYNMEKYLNKCLDSLIVDVNLMDKLEVLVVNDGSNDRSSEIAHEYEEKYPNTFIVIDKENGNYGSCINAGIKVAKGKYIKILDADDSFENKNFLAFITFLSGLQADMILTDYITIDDRENIIKTHSYNLPISEKIDFLSFCDTDIAKPIPMHCITYRRQILIDMGYRQQEGLSYTDIQWAFEPMIYVRDVYYYNQIIYRYLMGRLGQTCYGTLQPKAVRQHVIVNQNRIKFYLQHKNSVPELIKGFLIGNIAHEFAYIYHWTLIERSFNINELIDIDNNLKSINEVYNSPILLNNLIAKRIPFTYIPKWRKHYKLPYILTICRPFLRLKKKFEPIIEILIRFK